MVRSVSRGAGGAGRWIRQSSLLPPLQSTLIAGRYCASFCYLHTVPTPRLSLSPPTATTARSVFCFSHLCPLRREALCWSRCWRLKTSLLCIPPIHLDNALFFVGEWRNRAGGRLQTACYTSIWLIMKHVPQASTTPSPPIVPPLPLTGLRLLASCVASAVCELHELEVYHKLYIVIIKPEVLQISHLTQSDLCVVFQHGGTRSSCAHRVRIPPTFSFCCALNISSPSATAFTAVVSIH
ncbi:hypothetical protein GGR55DRAFT_183460 [Xylaria sp. FL0064]|nr:hypothetical protein GGR55DRAFT_183460 [Xylaria sp. FL0064]